MKDNPMSTNGFVQLDENDMKIMFLYCKFSERENLLFFSYFGKKKSVKRGD